MKKLFIPFLAILATSCGEPANSFCFVSPEAPSMRYETSGVKTINLKETFRQNIFANEFDSIRLVMLQLSDDCVISRISSLGITNDTITVVDHRGNTINLFNMDGEHIKTIGGKGQGPGEYSQISTSIVNGHNVFVTDFVANKTIHYRTNSSEISERINNACNPYHCWPLDDSVFIETHWYDKMLTNSPFELTITDGEQNVKESARPFTSNITRSGGTLTSGSDGAILFYSDLCDTIFSVSGNSIKPYLSLGIYNNENLAKFYSEAFATKYDDLQRFSNTKRSLPRYSFWESEHFWIVQMSDDKYTYKAFTDRQTLKTNTYVQFDKERGELHHLGNILCVSDDDWIAISLTESDLNSAPSKLIDQGLKALNDNDLENEIRSAADGNVNGCIMMLHIKKR